MRVRPARFVAVSVTAGTTVAMLSTGCGATTEPPSGNPVGPASTSAAPEPRAQLAARVAIAKDRRYVAAYTLTQSGRPNRAVVVTVAADTSWRVDIQGGALGGTADVSIAQRPEGQYQCTLALGSGCVRIAAKGAKLPSAVDPRVHYPFTTWMDLLTDRQVALSIAPAPALPGSSGDCFSVEPTSAAMQPVIDSSVLCYTGDGTLTMARAPFGTLALNGAPTPAPGTVTLAGPVTNAAPLSTAAPSPPPATASPGAPTPSRPKPSVTSKKP